MIHKWRRLQFGREYLNTFARGWGVSNARMPMPPLNKIWNTKKKKKLENEKLENFVSILSARGGGGQKLIILASDYMWTTSKSLLSWVYLVWKSLNSEHLAKSDGYTFLTHQAIYYCNFLISCLVCPNTLHLGGCYFSLIGTNICRDLIIWKAV